MPDLKDDLAALRIEREPQRTGAGRWIGWTILLLALAAAGVAAWNYFTAVRPVSVARARCSRGSTMRPTAPRWPWPRRRQKRPGAPSARTKCGSPRPAFRWAES